MIGYFLYGFRFGLTIAGKKSKAQKQQHSGPDDRCAHNL
jgi:hypothetical protein